MSEVKRACTTCKGTSFLYLKGRPIACPVCKGIGSLEPEATVVPTGSASQFSIAIVGEAWGDEEARAGLPFVGYSGKELNRMLEEAEIARHECFVTNTFNLQPPSVPGVRKNDILALATDRKGTSVTLPPMAKGKYLQDQYLPEVHRLWKELAQVQPNIVVALGNTALWALTGQYGIRALRGTVYPSSNPAGLKVLPTYHPAAVLRDWSLRPVVVADLMKVRRQSRFKEIRRPAREIWLEPSLNHIQLFYDTYVRRTKKLAFDIETTGEGYSQITCIGFATDESRAIVIPFTDNRKPGGSYWPSAEEERKAWELVRLYLSHPDSEKVGQNTLYDINWLWHKVGLTPVNYTRDTMLKHHALNPELEKGLGFLGSIYTDEPAWKIMRTKGVGTTKRGE